VGFSLRRSFRFLFSHVSKDTGKIHCFCLNIQGLIELLVYLLSFPQFLLCATVGLSAVPKLQNQNSKRINFIKQNRGTKFTNDKVTEIAIGSLQLEKYYYGSFADSCINPWEIFLSSGFDTF